MNIAIRVDLYDSIGWGHFKRSLILEKELVKKGYNVEFIFGELQSSSIVYKLMQGINYIIIGRDAEKNFWQDNSYKYKVVIYDVAHHDNRIDFTHTMNMLKILATNKVKTLFFDGAGKEMISSLYEMPVSLIVIPYACNHSICLNSVAIIGPEFFILDDKIKEYKKKVYNKNLILFTFGGSDPTNLSSLALSAIKYFIHNELLLDYQFYMICGPGYSNNSKKKLHDFKHSQYKVIDSPSCLGFYISNSKLVITATGLTKYEVAYLGAPSIHISSSNDLDEANKYFTSSGSALDLGIQSGVSVDLLINSIISLIHNRNLRRNIIMNSKKIIDGNGLSRVIQEIEKLYQK